MFNLNNLPNLYNLLTLSEVIPQDTMVEDVDSGEYINLNELIAGAKEELKEAGLI